MGLLLERGWGRSQGILDPLLLDEAKEAEQDRDRIPLEALRALLEAAKDDDPPKVYDG